MSKISLGIIGLGYIGLPVALSFAKKYKVIGYDLNKKRIKDLNDFNDTNNEFKKTKIKSSRKNIIFTSNPVYLSDCKIYIITVPTPIKKNKKPDLSYILEASKTVSRYLKNGDYIVYESTVYPGVTNEFCVPIIEKYSTLKCRTEHNYKKFKNNHFYVSYSPERINPGDKIHTFENINKILSASTRSATSYLAKIYSSVINCDVKKVKSIEIAEAAKVIENTQRDINIAFINELSIIFSKLNIDTIEVLKAASTKWNFINFKPGLVGGHCISVDPYYLTYKSKQSGYNPKLILSGRIINNYMSLHIVEVINKLIRKNFTNKNLKILIMGLSFKENCSDLRNTQVLNIYKKLNNKYNIDLYDPNVNQNEVKKLFKSTPIDTIKRNTYELILIAVAHKSFKKIGIKKIKSFLKSNKKMIVDINGLFLKKDTIFRL